MSKGFLITVLHAFLLRVQMPFFSKCCSSVWASIRELWHDKKLARVAPFSSDFKGKDRCICI